MSLDLITLARQAITQTIVNEGTPGKIGRHDGVIAYTDPAGAVRKERCWVRLGTDEVEIVAVCTKVQQLFDLPVRVADRGGIATVISLDDNQANVWHNGNSLATATHAWQHLRRGSDPLYIDSLMILSLLVIPTTPASMAVAINPGLYYHNGMAVWFDGVTSASLSAYIPGSAGLFHFVILAIDANTNTLVVVDGDDVEDTPLFPAEITGELVTAVAMPDNYLPLAAIRFYFGQTTIQLSDILFDMRTWLSGKGVGFSADEIMTDASGSVMVDADGNVMIEA